MFVGQILAAKPTNHVIVPMDEPVATTARLLHENGGRLALVADMKNKLQGVVSTTDIVRALGQMGSAAARAPVADIMTRDVSTCRPEDHVDVALQLMAKRRVRHLPVIENGLVLGVINLNAALDFRYREDELELGEIRKYVFSFGF